MIKQLALLIILVAGIVGTVFVVQKSTLLKSFGYDVVDFVASFHASEGDAEYNVNLDVYKDGMINTLDVLKDRYGQEATRSGGSSDSDDLSNVLESSDSADENF